MVKDPSDLLKALNDVDLQKRQTTFLRDYWGHFLHGNPFLVALKLSAVELASYRVTICPSLYLYSFLLTFVVPLGINGRLSFRIVKAMMVDSLKSFE